MQVKKELNVISWRDYDIIGMVDRKNDRLIDRNSWWEWMTDNNALFVELKLELEYFVMCLQ